MKELLILMISLLCISGLFAQSYTVKVTWDPDDVDCYCPGSSTDSSFVVDLYIRDVANSVTVVDTDKTELGTADETTFSVSAVEDYCDDIENYEEAPVFYIRATVSKKCSGSGIPVISCDGNETKENQTCGHFLTQIEILDVPLQ